MIPKLVDTQMVASTIALEHYIGLQQHHIILKLGLWRLLELQPNQITPKLEINTGFLIQCLGKSGKLPLFSKIDNDIDDNFELKEGIV